MSGRSSRSEASLRSRCLEVCSTQVFFNGVKTLLILLNFFFLILGSSLMGVGAWLHVEHGLFYYAALIFLYDAQQRAVTSHEGVPVVLLVIGGFVVVLSSIGCCGVYSESLCFLAFYLTVLSALVVTEVIVGSITAAVKEKSLQSLLVNMQQQLRHEYNSTAAAILGNGDVTRGEKDGELTSSDNLTIAWDTLQTQLTCCGGAGPRDYMDSSWFNHTRDESGLFVPSSCCFLLAPMGGGERENMCQIEAILYPNRVAAAHLGTLHYQGCHSAIVSWLQAYERLTIGLVGFTVFIQVVDVLFVLLLMKLIRIKLSYYATNRPQRDDSLVAGRRDLDCLPNQDIDAESSEEEQVPLSQPATGIASSTSGEAQKPVEGEAVVVTDPPNEVRERTEVTSDKTVEKDKLRKADLDTEAAAGEAAAAAVTVRKKRRPGAKKKSRNFELQNMES